MLLATSAFAEDVGFNPGGMTLDELMFHAARYGNTPEKREHKVAAKEELLARGPEALRYLVGNSHLKNMWFAIFAQELVQLNPSQAVPILFGALGDEHEDVRKTAAFLLGFCYAPERADELMPLLDDGAMAGAVVRTLGKWHVRAAVPRIVPFLQDEDERRRVAAANALHDIADDRAAPYLVQTLGDPVFTVRQAASRALARLGPAGEDALIRALDRARGQDLRNMIRTLGVMRSRKAVRSLRGLLQSADWGVRGDAARALSAIDPFESPGWLRGMLPGEKDPFVRAALPPLL